ncbi:asparaginyl-tRNA synthetase [Orbilia oligospora]|uniref:Asparaginyl-tRNA synthetase n=1 Tax=Orbilia oligospora TaxID=2813651 RepID=A0A7C8R2G7_ORBOL|nr:asparaginyl-tRNA synthetase [Orbilia oligospora]
MTPEQGSALTIGAAAKITGSWQESPVKKAQQKELLATDVKLLAESDPGTYPLQKKSHTFEYLRTIPHLRLRSSTSRSILQLRSTALSQISTYFTENSFTQVQPPILTSSDCEGAGEVFAVTASDRKPFFSDPVYLTVSSQLHLEAVALAMSKVWCMSPTFRAEKSDTARHLNEFYMLEAEMAFVENGIEDVMKVVEGVIKSIVQGLVNNEVLKKDLLIRRSDDVGLLEPEQLEKRWDGIINMPWRRVTYTKAIETLKQAVKRGEDYKARMSSSLNPNSKGALEVQVPWDEGAEFKFPVEWGMNLQSEHEKYLAYAVGGGAPVFITDYPKQLKPFYMLPNSNGNKDEEGRETVACFDLLLPQVGEIVGGSMRENRYDMLEGEMKRRGMSEESIQQLGWYLELRKWGCAPLGGFGIGFDRLLAYLAGVENIRETVAFPRWFDRCHVKQSTTRLSTTIYISPAVMFLPPEILLSILEELKTDRSTLHNLRLVDKYFCQVATDILFGDFSVHYGFRHSVPQMKAIIKSPGLQPYIRSLHLPSESFFPIARNFKLREGGGYRFPWSRDLSKEVNPPARRHCYEQQADSKGYRGYLEVPTNRNATFSFGVKRYQNEYDKYTKTLTQFLKTCVNLRAIHITTGLGYEAERSEVWCRMIGSRVFPILVEQGIKRLDMSLASGDCLFKILHQYGQDTANGPKLKQRPMELLPTQYTQHNITSLTLSCMYLSEEMFNNFKSSILSMQLLTNLTLDTVALSTSAEFQVDEYPERKLPKAMSSPSPPEASASQFCLFDSSGDLVNPFGSTYSPQINFDFDSFLNPRLRTITAYELKNFHSLWKAFFAMLQERLTELAEFSFKRLIYTPPRPIGGRSALLIIPVQDREDYNRRDFQKFARGTYDMELISTLENDYLALESLRKEVNERRHKRGLAELKCESKSEGFGKANSENDFGRLSEDIPGFEHQTKNKRIILLSYDSLWSDISLKGPIRDMELQYWTVW